MVNAGRARLNFRLTGNGSPAFCCGWTSFTNALPGLHCALMEAMDDMTWMIGRNEAMADPLAARRKVLERLRGLTELEDPEAQVVPVLIDAILLAETYRGARHPMPFVDELIKSVDALLRELTISEKAKTFADV